ncbi:MAG: hypothetical protein J5948_02270 [Bacteroidales bacterium]|nr:hypothetical protein [Bacteroidales bacterium]
MKIRHFFMALLAGAAVFTACQEKEEDLGPAKVTVSPVELAFDAAEGSKTVELTATRDWTIQSNPDWVALNVTSGQGSTKAQTITVSVTENKSNNREGEVIFTIGLSKATLKVTQAGPGGEIQMGDGTLESPFSVAGAIKFIEGLGADVQSDKSVYVKGRVSTVETTFEGSGTYGNATFNMVDAEGSTDVFKAFQTYYLNNRKWRSGDKEVKTGDEVIVYGPVVNYKGNTPETVGKGASYIYSLNGETDGGNPTPDYENAPAKTVAEFIAAADNSTYYKLTGTVGGSINTQYGNFDLTDETGTIYVYGTDNIADYADKLTAGAKVTLAATYEYYEKSEKHEAVNAYILSLEEAQPVEETEHGPTTIAAFLAAEESTTDWYELTGVISNLKDGDNYGNFDLTDETGTVYVYGVLSTKGGEKKKFQDLVTAHGIKNGGTITIKANRGSYNDKIEALNAYFVSYKDDGSSQGGGESGDVKKATVAEFIAAEESDSQKYELTGTIGGSINTTYGNFDLTDETGTVYVYGLTATELGYGASNDKSYASLGLAEGDKIKIIGYRGSYNDKIEVMYAYFVEKISDGGQGGGEEQPTGDFASNVTWSDDKDNSAFDEKATVNGVSDVPVLKLGTGSKTGSYELTLPEGSTSLTFYALSWKGKPTELVFTVGDTVNTVPPAANDGLSNKSPYTLTVTESDKYTITFPATSTVKVETSGSNTRAALFGIQAK